MKRVCLALAVVGIVSLFAFQRPVDSAEPALDLRLQMKNKLLHAQLVLEGLAGGEFNKIERGARHLRDSSGGKAWDLHKTPEYMVFSRRFHNVTKELVDHAKKRNMEACTLSYVRMTILCVDCHSHLRDIKVAGLDETELPLLATNGPKYADLLKTTQE